MNRAYRITFAHKVGKFVIEIQGLLGLFWSPAKDGSKVRHFDTYEQAVNHVKTIGLDRVYQDFTFKAPFGSQQGGQVGPSLAEIQEAYGPRNKLSVRWLDNSANSPFPTLNKEQA